MSREQQVSAVFVDVADSLTDDFDVIDFLEQLCTHCVALLDVSAAGILLAGEGDTLHTIAASDENTHLLELFALQHDQGPCLDCYRDGQARINIDLHSAQETYACPSSPQPPAPAASAPVTCSPCACGPARSVR